MSLSATRTQKSVGGISVSSSKIFSGDVRESQSYAVADAASDEEHSLNIDITELQYFCIKSDQPVTLEFNNSGAGVPVIVLVADVPFEEYGTGSAQYHVAKFTVDITTLYVTNASGSAANIEIIVVKNNTPYEALWRLRAKI